MVFCACLNSLADSPRLFASLGRRAAPKRTMTIKRTMMSSVGPRFKTETPLSGGPSGDPDGPPATATRLLAARDLLDGGPDAEVRPATAQVSAHRFVDVSVRRVRVVVQQRHCLHDL